MYTLAHENSKHTAHKENEKLTSGIAYHSSEPFALQDGNLVYNHPLFRRSTCPYVAS